MSREEIETLVIELGSQFTADEFEALILKIHTEYFATKQWQGCTGALCAAVYLMRQHELMVTYVKDNFDKVIKDYFAYRELTYDYFNEGKRNKEAAEITLYISFSIKYMRDDLEEIFK